MYVFFLYLPPDHEREIDVEIYNDSSRRIMFTTYSGGRQTHTATKRLPFDPTAGYHTYAFRYDEDLARFTVDGNTMQTWKTGVPRGACTSTRTSGSRTGWTSRGRSWTPTST